MKKKSLIILIFVLAFIMIPFKISAASVYQVDSIDELQTILTEYGADDFSDVSIAVLGTIIIPDNTVVDLKGCTIISDGASYVFNISGKNASIENGIIVGGGIKVTSSDNPTGYIKDIIISGAPDTGIYVVGNLGGIDSCRINSPKGNGVYLSGGNISGDITNNFIEKCGGIGLFLRSNSKCGNIDGNVIKGSYDHAIRLVGSKNASSNNGSSAGDIINNIITDCGGHGISLYHGSHCGKISNNNLQNIGGTHEGTIGDFGIMINSGCPYRTYASEITNNTLNRISYAGIAVFSGPKGDVSGKWQDNAYVSGDIAYNSVSHSGSWNKKVDWSKGSSDDKHPCEGSIYIDSHSTLYGDIHHNTINEPYDNGICVLAYSSAHNIYSNKIINAHNAGIMITNHSSVIGSVRNNTITSPHVYGIFFNNASIGKTIFKNTINTPGKDGIAVMKSSIVKTVSSNTIKGAKLYGVVSANSKAIIQVLCKNKISMGNGKKGIGILCNTGTSITQITGNKVSGNYSRGIRIKSPIKKIGIKSNTVFSSNPKSIHTIPISVEGCKKKTIRIIRNKLTGNNTAAGIYIKTSSGVIKKNNIKKSKRKIYVVKGVYKVKR